MSTPYKWKMNITAVPLVTVARRLDFSSARFHWLLGDTLRTRLPVCVAQQACVCATRSWLADKVQETQQFGPRSCDPALSSQCTQYRTDSDYEGRKHESSCSSPMKRRHSAVLQRCKGEASARCPATQTRCVFATFCHLICQCDPGAAPQTAGSGESSRKSQ